MLTELGRRDAALYLIAGTLGSFGVGIAAFYLNFVYRGLGLSDLAIGALAACQALGVVAGALPAARFARRHPRRTSLLVGGTVTGAGLVGIVLLDAFPTLALSAALVGGGGILVSASGAALLADASRGSGRVRLFGQQVALGTAAVFLASVAAGALAAPVAGLLGLAPGDVRAVRALVALGAGLAALSGLPVLLLRPAAIPRAVQSAPVRRGLLVRFLAVEVAFGLGAGSFLPFVNLFFADRFGVPFAGLGIVLGTLAVAGSLGALAHGRLVVPRLGSLRGMVVTEAASLPFALAAAFAPLPLAVTLLAARALLMYGSSATLNAYTLSSFTPAERAGASATLSIGYYAAFAAGSLISGTVRTALGDAGWTANLATLALGYGLAAVLQLRLFRAHTPAGDAAGAIFRTAPDSTA